MGLSRRKCYIIHRKNHFQYKFWKTNILFCVASDLCWNSSSTIFDTMKNHNFGLVLIKEKVFGPPTFPSSFFFHLLLNDYQLNGLLKKLREFCEIIEWEDCHFIKILSNKDYNSIQANRSTSYYFFQEFKDVELSWYLSKRGIYLSIVNTPWGFVICRVSWWKENWLWDAAAYTLYSPAYAQISDATNYFSLSILP